MTRQQVEALVREATATPRHGQWAAFARQHGLTRDQVFHWRKKLGLPRRSGPAPTLPTALVAIACLGLSGCAGRTVYVDRPRTVEVPVPVTQPVPPELTQGCPAQGELRTVGEYLEWLKICVALLDFQREKVRGLR